MAQTARTRGEVIVSGGVFNSPQLLQLSGLGPAELLHSKPITMNDVANSFLRRTVAGVRYALLRSGPLASNGVCAGAFARSDPRLEHPDLQVNFTTWSYGGRDRMGVRAHPFPDIGRDLAWAFVNTDAEFEVSIRWSGLSNLHPVGSGRMGTDEAAALDPRLRVRGVGRLRVVDASIMPSVPAGDTNAPTIMIGEKASDTILGDARATA